MSQRVVMLMTDEQIVEMLHKSDTAGLEAAIDRYGRLVESIAVRMLESRSDCEEAVSDTFFKLWRYRKEVDLERSSLKGFICMLAKNCVTDRLRYNNRIKRREVIPPEENDLGIDVDYENAEAKRLNQMLIIECVSTMPSPEKEVFVDRYYFNMPIKDIADREKLDRRAVEAHLRKGKRRLREALLKGGVLNEKY